MRGMSTGEGRNVSCALLLYRIEFIIIAIPDPGIPYSVLYILALSNSSRFADVAQWNVALIT